MRFVPSSDLADGTPPIVIGGPPHAGAHLVLSNQPGVHVPDEVRADTSAEMALRLLDSPLARSIIGEGSAMTAARCDTDALLAVWTLLHPEDARSRRERIAAAARAGAFRVGLTPEACQFDCWVRGYRFQEGLEDEGEAFTALLPHVRAMLDNPREMDLYWIGEYSDLIHDTAMLNSGAVQVEEHPELDLAVMETPLTLHDLVRFAPLSAFRLLTVRSENTYIVEYRRESGVRYHSRRPSPRLDLAPLATRLNMFERRDGRWRSEPLDAAAPRLFLDNGNGRPAPSGIDAETVTAEVLDFFTAAASRADLHWSPYDGDAK